MSPEEKRVKAAVRKRRSRTRQKDVLTYDEVLYQYIDFYAEPVSGKERDWHYRYEGPGAENEARVKVLRRLYALINDRELPKGAKLWCEDEAPWCVNPDHVIEDGELMFWDAEWPVVGMQSSVVGDTEYERLRSLDRNGWRYGETDEERMANEFLKERGFNLDGI